MNVWFDFPVTYTHTYLPVDKQWNHLESVINQISVKDSISVSLLIGANCTILTLFLIKTMDFMYL